MIRTSAHENIVGPVEVLLPVLVSVPEPRMVPVLMMIVPLGVEAITVPDRVMLPVCHGAKVPILRVYILPFIVKGVGLLLLNVK